MANICHNLQDNVKNHSTKSKRKRISLMYFFDEELSNFPKLFYLDDYDRCLLKKDGLYCLGTFDLTPNVQPSPTYDLLKEYSDEAYRHFNRTRIHRGYCVNSRCPHETERNASLRFERCADAWARPRSLRASINTLHYCHTQADKQAEKPTTPAEQIFIQCIYAIVVINIIGTIYDMYTKDSPNKNKLLTSFSIPANWRRLTVIHENADPRLASLAPLIGIKTIAMAFTTYAHSNVFHYAFYILNPEFLEQQTQRIDGIFMADGTSLMQAIVMMACFLTGYNLLLFSQKRPLSISMLPLCILKRVVRIAPVNLLVIGYAATWWIHSRDGPLVPTTIGREHAACQKKFWSHVFYVNNIVNPSEYCVVPTWFLAMDMHMYIVACTLTLLMWQRRSLALKLYLFLFLASCVVTAVVAYINQYKSVVFLATPEHIRNTFRESPSFTHFYISSWGSLPSCLLGLILAHIHYEMDEKRINLSEYRWYVYLHYCMVPLMFTWALTGKYARSYGSRLFYAVYLALDRPLYCIISCICLLGLMRIDSPVRRFYSWRGWTVLTSVSLTVMLLHWCVNMSIATRPVAYGTSVFDMNVDWLATNLLTYILAIPITLLLEIPMRRFLSLLLF